MSYHSGFKYIDGTDGQGESFILPDVLEVKNLDVEEDITAVNGDFSGIVEAKELKSNEIDTIGDNDLVIKRNDIDNITLTSNNISLKRLVEFVNQGAQNPQTVFKRADGGDGAFATIRDMTIFTGLDGPGVSDFQIFNQTTNSNFHFRSNGGKTMIHSGIPNQSIFQIYGSTGSVNRRDIELRTHQTRGGELLVNCLTASPATPSYSFLNDTNTGMYRVTDDVIGFSCAGSEQLAISSNGLKISGMPYLELTNNTAQSIPNNTITTIINNWNVITQTNILITSGVIQISVAGKYAVSYAAGFQGTASGGNERTVFISKNDGDDTRYAMNTEIVSIGQIIRFNGSCILNLAVLDTVRLKCFQNSSAALNFGGSVAGEIVSLQIHKLS